MSNFRKVVLALTLLAITVYPVARVHALTGTAAEIEALDGAFGFDGTIGVNKGGTGAVSFTDAGVLIGNVGGAIQVTTAGTQGQALVSNGVGNDPAFEALDLGDADAITGLLPLANGGTNKLLAAGVGQILFLDADSVEALAAGNVGNTLKSNGAADPTWSALYLAGGANYVTGLLPLANGGTNKDLTPVTAGAVIYQGADSLEKTAVAGSSGLCLKSTGNGSGAPAFSDCINGSGNRTIAVGTQFNVSGGSTNYIGFGTGVDSTEARAQQVASVAMQSANLRCVSSISPGADEDFTITLRFGACGAQADSAVQVCIIDGDVGSTCVTGGGPQAIAAGNCYDYEVVASATAAAAVVNCSSSY